MTENKNSRRTFFKKAAATVGIIAAADYIRTLLSVRPYSDEVTERYASDSNAQKMIFSKKQLVLMTDNEKEQRLAELLSNYQKGST